jgi:prepilin-type N-terminal cleavage/methylation domain-containing protein
MVISPKKPRIRRRFSGSQGFTLIEIMVGLCVLALAFVSLSAYTAGQRKGLYKSGQFADATQVAASALETMKGTLADSLKFKQLYNQVANYPNTISSQKMVNNFPYTIAITLTRAPAPLYALNVRAKVSWKSIHTYELGMLFPGTASAL